MMEGQAEIGDWYKTETAVEIHVRGLHAEKTSSNPPVAYRGEFWWNTNYSQ